MGNIQSNNNIQKISFQDIDYCLKHTTTPPITQDKIKYLLINNISLKKLIS